MKMWALSPHRRHKITRYVLPQLKNAQEVETNNSPIAQKVGESLKIKSGHFSPRQPGKYVPGRGLAASAKAGVGQHRGEQDSLWSLAELGSQEPRADVRARQPPARLPLIHQMAEALLPQEMLQV